MTTKLVYTGSVPTTFVSHLVAVQPGESFTVPDDQLERFIGRSDIELAPEPEPELTEVPVEEPAPAPKSTKKAAQ